MKLILNCFAALAFACSLQGAFAAGLVVPQGGISLGEVQPGEAVAAEVVVSNDAERTIAVSRVKACCGGEATMEPMSVPAKGEAKLMLRMKAQVPGEIAKAVTLYCDDPYRPIVEIPVTGRVVETAEVKMMAGGTVAAIIAAGLVDGFNPCAFSIIIGLAGVLAVGSHTRRARMLAGWAFCFGSFLTYMLMGLGLMRALKALRAFQSVHDVVMYCLAGALFVCSALSVRDAFRYRKAKVPGVITLQLPDTVKKLIRTIAEVSWSGPTVVVAGIGCGFLVTLLDSLCTGQVYVPVLTLLSCDPHAWHAFALLVIYNLAFIAPLITIFILAAKGADAARMSVWSKRNVFPSKIGLGVIFALLGVLILTV